ncbi:MAG: transporter substrate-binding domain-containing protein [Lachnospiraceae bacterium]|nr:transporter substrate-binding domain-containing protein [Lachnospiraceae bacterium]
MKKTGIRKESRWTGRTVWRKFAATAAALAVLALAGCGGAGNSAEGSSGTGAALTGSGDQLARIREAGKITVAMEGTWAPWTYHDESDKLVGFDVEVAQQIAGKLGVEAEFIEGEWDGLLAGLEAGRYDIMVNGVDYTEERAQKYDFTEPYGYIRTAIIVNKDNTDITSFEDLKGKTTANTISSTYAELAERYGATTTGVDDLNQTIELLLQKRIDATLNAEVTFYDYMGVHPDAALKIAALTEDANHVCIPLRKGEDSQSLREAINQAIAELKADGTLGQISEKYFGTDITK